ncbi:MAG: RagB/SusD family nutrient uptake outer membrane protein [Chitinophagaceae bacterium]|nr:RagB/SusD family nutrient uptake outer membrane protein [Chitinophagaceae bacterium]
MNMNIYKTIYILSLAVLLLFTAGCEKILDRKDLRSINPGDVWNDVGLATAFVNNIYGDLMTGMPTNQGGASDECTDNGEMRTFLAGIATIDSYNSFPYGTILKINMALENLEKGGLPEADRNKLKGQVLFWRAWAYFMMVKAYGGVPLVLNTQDVSDKEQLFVPRSKTSECITQIAKDIDDAIALLPDAWPGEEGRIDKGVAMAFKGRVLLYYASPQFMPSGNAARWQAAYDANKEALQYLTGKGKGLMDHFGDIWYQELNKEVIMVRRYAPVPAPTHSQAGMRPILYSKDAANQDIPSLQLVNAFPMKDGSVFNPATTSYDTLFKNRDERFYASIAYNGSDMGLKDMVDLGTYLWTYWGPNGSVIGPLGTPTSFYRQKGLDKTLTQQTVHAGTVDWIEIRFAEVLMNFGEAANELDKTIEALDVLYQIRSRAGILPGNDGHYGITAASKDAIREAYMNERFVEFAFEDKRWWDLRRWRRLDILNTVHRRTGLRYTLKTGQTAPAGHDDINTVWNRFTWEVVTVDTRDIEVQDNYYFYGIPMYVLERSSNIEQTQGWNNGAFDPLQ